MTSRGTQGFVAVPPQTWGETSARVKFSASFALVGDQCHPDLWIIRMDSAPTGRGRLSRAE